MNHQAVSQRPTPIHWAVELSSWVPVTNVAYGLTALFVKYVYIPFASEATIDGSQWLTKIDRESGWTPVFVLIPFLGRLGIFIYDRRSKKIAIEYGTSLANLRPWLRNDRDVVHAAIANRPLDLQYADRLLRNDRRIVLSAVTNNFRGGDFDPFTFASEALQNTLEIQLAAIRRNAASLARIAPLYTPGTAESLNFFERAVQANGLALQHLPEWLLQPEQEHVLIRLAEMAVRVSPHAFRHLPSCLFSDAHAEAVKRITINAVKHDWSLLQYAFLREKDDLDVLLSVKDAFSDYGITRALPFATERVRSLYQNAERLKADEKAMLDGIAEDPALLARIAPLYTPGTAESLNFFERAVQANGLALQHLPEWFLQPEQEHVLIHLAEMAVHQNPRAFQHLPPCLFSDAHAEAVKRITIDAVSLDPTMLKYACVREQDNREVVFSARYYGKDGVDLAMEFASERIRNLHRNAQRLTEDEEAMLDAIAEDASVLKHYGVPERHQNNKAFMLKAIARNPQTFLYASRVLKNDFIVALAAVEGDGLLFSKVGSSLSKSTSLAQAAYRSNPQVLKNLSSRPTSWLKFAFIHFYPNEDALLEAIGRVAEQ